MPEKMEEKKVSIIIPVYNVEKYICKCLDSVVNQTYRNLEIIINNDGSTDSSMEICKTYAQSDERIKLYSQENKGLSAARNAVLPKITGDYFFFLDSDDWIMPDAIEKMVRLKQHYNADCVAVNVKSTLKENFKEKVSKIKNITFDGRSFSHKMLQPMGYFCYAWGRLFDADIATKVHFPENYIFEDIFTMPALIYDMDTIVRTTEKLYCYRFRRTGLSHAKFQRRSTDEMDAYLSVFKFAMAKDDFKLARNAIIFFLTKYYWYFVKVMFSRIGIVEYRRKYKDYAKWLRIQLFNGHFVLNETLYNNELHPWR